MSARDKRFYLASLQNKAMVEVWKAIEKGATPQEIEAAINALKAKAVNASRQGY